MIYCFGDSFTFGDELEDRANAWPGVLNQMTDHIVVGIAKPGASNSWICNKVIQKCLEQKPQLAIVAWTTSDRYEFFGEDNVSLCVNVNDGDTDPFIKQLYSDYHDTSGKFVEWICQAILLQNFLENQGIEYRFVHAFASGISDILDKNKNSPHFKKMLSFLNTDRFIGWLEDDFIKWSKGSPLGPHGHFLEQGHRQVAEQMYERIRDII